MEKKNEFLFSESCQTICLSKSDVFVSSFPGKVVFGEPNFLGYLVLKNFQFKHYEFFNLYLSLIKIVQFFATSSQEEKGLILQKTLNTIYFWSGAFLQENGKNPYKIIKFGIEFDFNIVFEIVMNVEQFNELILQLPNFMLSCLCLKSEELNHIESFANEMTLSNLVSFNNVKMRKNIFKIYKNLFQNINSVSEPNLINLFVHYNELIIIYKKMKSLYNHKINDTNRIEEILKH
jgi:hypothetical protein